MKKLLSTLLVLSLFAFVHRSEADCQCETTYVADIQVSGYNGLGVYFFRADSCPGYTPAYCTTFPYYDIWSATLFDYLWIPPGATVTLQIGNFNYTFGPFSTARAYHYTGPSGSSGNYTWTLTASRPACWHQTDGGGMYPGYPDNVEAWTCCSPHTFQSPYAAALCQDTCL